VPGDTSDGRIHGRIGAIILLSKNFCLVYIQGVFEVEAFLVTRGTIHYS
jgi:hypothetical protein